MTKKTSRKLGLLLLVLAVVLCGVCLGASHRQFSMEQQRHLWRLSGVYFVDGSASLGAIWEKTEVII